METEVKPLWPKGWMQTRLVSFYINYLPALNKNSHIGIFDVFISVDRMLFKESIMAHGHLTGYT